MASIIEQQYDELTLAKKQVLEYEVRESLCQNQWNSFIQENIHKDEKIRGIKLQIERNLDNLQLLMNDHDHQIYELCKKVYEIVGE